MTRSARLLMWFVVLLCVGFAPVAAEFGFVTLQGGVPTYARILAWLVSDEYAYGPASGFAQLVPHWTGMATWLQWVLAVHAVLASVVMLLCLVQLRDGSAGRRLARHRWLGRWTAGMGVLAMVLAFVYLAATPMEAIYGGPPFAMGLWGMAVLSLWALGLGIDQARRGALEAHRAFMWMFAATMFVAPSLRLHWVVFGWLLGEGPHATQATAHVLALMVLSVQTPMVAIAVMSRKALRRVPHEVAAPAWLVWPILMAVSGAWSGAPGFFESLGLDVAGIALGVASVMWGVYFLGRDVSSRRGHWENLGALALTSVVWWVCAWLTWPSQGLAADHLRLGQAAYFVVLGVSSGMLLALAILAARRHHAVLVYELGLHGLAMTLIPGLHTVLFQGQLIAGLNMADAWLGAAVLAPGVVWSLSFYATAFRSQLMAEPSPGLALA